jgi:hypothetical protein
MSGKRPPRAKSGVFVPAHFPTFSTISTERGRSGFGRENAISDIDFGSLVRLKDIHLAHWASAALRQKRKTRKRESNETSSLPGALFSYTNLEQRLVGKCLQN